MHFLGGADRLDHDHGVDDAAVVEHLADLCRGSPAPRPLSWTYLKMSSNTGKSVPGAVKVGALVALGGVARRLDVGLGARPPNADEVIHRIADRGGFLDRGRVHHPPAPHQHPVGPQLAADLQPGRLLLEAGVRDREQRQLVAVGLRELFQRRDRLLAVGAVVIDQGDLLALQVVHAAFLLADVFDQRGGLAPVGHRRVEDVGEHPAVGGVGPPVAHREDRDLVGRGALDQGVGDAGAVGVDHRGAGRAVVLEPLVALDAAVVVVGGLALLPGAA